MEAQSDNAHKKIPIRRQDINKVPCKQPMPAVWNILDGENHQCSESIEVIVIRDEMG